jgi:putative ABC transport system ATP-binding protein
VCHLPRPASARTAGCPPRPPSGRARARASRPRLVFADEPTGNLDSRASGKLLALLRRAVDELGQTSAMVTHDPVAAAHADAVLFLADGRIVDRVERPTAQLVIDRIKALGE